MRMALAIEAGVAFAKACRPSYQRSLAAEAQREREADEDIAAGRMTYYDSDEAFLESLDNA
jgi:hypothetical protein